jgi:hypothetical protein
MASEQLYAVDRIQQRTAVLVGEDQHHVLVPMSRLPRELKAGHVLRVPTNEEDTPDWGRAWIDEEETRQRKAQARKALEELEERDPGGDIET